MSLKDSQFKFAQFLRDPENEELPDGIEPRRAQVYQELVYNNINGLLIENFPVIRQILSDEKWHALIREFIKNYRTDNPYFPKVGQVFVEFLSQRERQADEPMFLLELAHYENIEFEILLADDHSGFVDSSELLEQSILKLSGTAVPLAYQFPVHQISEDFQPNQLPPEPTFLLVFQDQEQSVRFFELQVIVYHLLMALSKNEEMPLRTITDTLLKAIKENEPGFDMDNDVFFENAVNSLKQFESLCVIKSKC